MSNQMWHFGIDVGGTFCDVFAHAPDGSVHTHKCLSSGRTKGVAGVSSGDHALVDPARRNDPPNFWRGYQCALLDDAGQPTITTDVVAFDHRTGTLSLGDSLDGVIGPGGVQPAVVAYELFSREPAPVSAVRYLLGLTLDNEVPPCHMRLGTTLATNALLQRGGPRTALVTTQGFADLLRIGDQTRPHLFRLNIKKPDLLNETAVELVERIDADGNVLVPLDQVRAERTLDDLHASGIESVAICLMNAYRNGEHERLAANIARRVGFANVSVSSKIAPTQRIVARAESCVVDAYLAPVFRDYLAEIQSAMPAASILLMTGAGGLVGATSFSGNDSVLSGPAGGLVGAARIARSDAARRGRRTSIITFDMGGTSTDVARFDGTFQYDHEVQKAGVRIVAPVLAIETVAAGGGSICRFDGVSFKVGPQSAGTDPGPACYGRGGPITLTDANLFLGRLPPARFPFPLNRDAVLAGFQEIAEEISDAGQPAMTLCEIAEGFIRIANADMAAAVKRITIERGFDASAHTLVCFGGAGGQHACAVARSLGIKDILLSPLAGVLSAFGIASADITRWAQQPVHAFFDAQRLKPIFAGLERELADRLASDNVVTAPMAFHRYLDMRYIGEGAYISVPGMDAGAAFEGEHQRRFGYVHEDRDIEVVNARVQAVVRTRHDVLPSHRSHDAKRTTPTIASVAFASQPHAGGTDGGGKLDTPVIDGSALQPGRSIDGPAIVAESTSTIVIDRGWRATVTESGDLLLRDSGVGAPPVTGVRADADPVSLELFNNHFVAIAEQMGTVLRKTAVSTNVKERLDYSCAVFDSAGRLVANAPHIPVHLGSMADCVKTILADLPDLASGDAVVTNDPYRGGTHLPDVTVVTPVFVDGCRSFFVASRAHHAEIGGVCPGSMPPTAVNLGQEGVRIHAFKIVDSGRDRFDELRALLTGGAYPSRAPDDNIADITAQIAANRTGIDALQSLVEQSGIRTVLAYTDHVRAAAEQKARAAIRKLPNGCFRRTESLDDGSEISVAITIESDTARIDFAGTAPPLLSTLNAPPAIVTSAVLYCFRCLIDDDIPLNEGVLAPIRIIIPTSMLNPPRDDDAPHCAAVSGGNVETSQRVVDTVFGALHVAAASQGTMNNLSFGNDKIAYYETVCGGHGAGPDYHGASAVHTHMTNTRLTDPEVLESRFPVRLLRFQIRTGSGGRGRYNGGDGCEREMQFLQRMELSLITQRRTTQPYGLDGGQPGRSGLNQLVSARTGEVQTLPPIVQITVEPGDRIIVKTPGGGGFGRPSP